MSVKFSFKIGCRTIILLNKINIITYFENLNVEFYVFYVFNMYVKFCANHILFTDIIIDFYFFLVILQT